MAGIHSGMVPDLTAARKPRYPGDKVDRAYSEGREAAFTGKPNVNPHPAADYPAHTAWQLGYDNAGTASAQIQTAYGTGAAPAPNYLLNFGGDTFITIPGLVASSTQETYIELVMRPTAALSPGLPRYLFRWVGGTPWNATHSPSSAIISVSLKQLPTNTSSILTANTNATFAAYWPGIAGNGHVGLNGEEISCPVGTGSNTGFTIGYTATDGFIGRISEFKIWFSDKVGEPDHYWKINEGPGQTTIIDCGKASTTYNGTLTLGSGSWVAV